MERTVKTQIRGYKTKDGAGVNLIRVLGYETERCDICKCKMQLPPLLCLPKVSP